MIDISIRSRVFLFFEKTTTTNEHIQTANKDFGTDFF